MAVLVLKSFISKEVYVIKFNPSYETVSRNRKLSIVPYRHVRAAVTSYKSYAIIYHTLYSYSDHRPWNPVAYTLLAERDVFLLTSNTWHASWNTCTCTSGVVSKISPPLLCRMVPRFTWPRMYKLLLSLLCGDHRFSRCFRYWLKFISSKPVDSST